MYKIFSAFLLVALPLLTVGGATTGEFLARQHQFGAHTLNYQILYPEGFDEARQYPLVLFLHGAGERGSDNQKQLANGSQLFLDHQKDFPAVVIFPQCPKDDFWASVNRERRADGERQFSFRGEGEPTPTLAAVMDLIGQESNQAYVDPHRLYVMGLSMGGMGTWELLWRMPGTFAAAAPICGGGAMEKAGEMRNIPIWAFHGMQDDVVPPMYTWRMISRVQAAGNNTAKVSLYPEANHNSWDAAFAEPELLPWLFDKQLSDLPNRTTPPTSPRVQALLDKMTLQEKIGQLNLVTPGGAVTGSVVSEDVDKKIRDGQVGGIFGLKGAAKMRQLQEIAVEGSRLGIPLITGMDVIHGHRTIFPIPLGLSCTWDPELLSETAKVAAREATADGIMWTFSPMVDVSRDPRWGRISEGAGEDPYLGSRIAEAMVKGYQQDDLSDPLTMLACVKHFAAYGAPEGGRDYATVDMSRVRLHNEYLPPYKAAIDAGVGTIMTSFNTVDYVPVSGNDYLFDKVLRKDWGFDGFVVTDYTAINEMIAHGLGDLQHVSAEALKAGVDMDMVGEGFVKTLEQSLREGKITESQIEMACRRILEAKERLGLLDDPYRYFDEARNETELLSPENRAIARRVSSQAAVLLKNEGNVLPLSPNAKIALVGPLADDTRNMAGTWSVSADHSASVSVLTGLQAQIASGGKVLYARGSNISDDPVFAKRVNAFAQEIVIDERSPEDMIEEALAVAKKADVIVAALGEAADMSGEASSMAFIGLQPAQRKLLEALKTTGKPIVLLLFNGRPMTLTWEDEHLDAILDVWHLGTEAGHAAADLLFGRVNPGGKLSTSFPVSVGQIPVYHSMLNTGRPSLEGNGPKFKSNYLDIPNEPLYPFGYGLSYTTFELGDPAISAPTLSVGNTLDVTVTVRNTGERAGAEVVQLYLRDVAASISRPMRELKGFEKVMLSPGESKTVTFTIDESLLKFYNADARWVIEPGRFEVFIGTNSRDTKTLSFEYGK